MTQVKLFQVRDVATHIPVMCTLLFNNDADDSRELARAGFGRWIRYVLLTNLLTCETKYDPFGWTGAYEGTLGTVHRYIVANWASLSTGDVLDAEFLRGESAEPKQPQ